ncbi:two component, sigma54 specific, transcriptional regulator, Fis family [Thioalkalivibrio sp. K90mix]|uniref:sigma-54-dependent transcriptional regulator n=1 Tax=unclassified Thioalkalivibrio TaxID=2621013 RepID=UPI000195A82E|nr:MULTISPECIES: sigma-54 dependent transcriptional regulator [unclassified Thioalkalivibrio]ADC71503.1 two component, sigma54 specific, transcriptional regulator, Fis family [Thioalkalivibrio sp. K90mix]
MSMDSEPTRGPAAEPGNARLLVIDDEPIACRQLEQVFRRSPCTVVTHEDGAAGLQALEQERFDAVLTDLRMAGVDGMQILHRARELDPDLAVIMITGHATLDSAVEAMKAGAFHYIAKPFRIDEVREVVAKAVEFTRLRRENHALRDQVEQGGRRATLVAQDAAMQRLLETARQIAPTDCNVVLTGESGTGKELLARYIHNHSNRAAGPFLAVNCGALQDELLASELFGHEKGAFTGATQQKKGLFESAAGGTLFLDEVAETSPAMQVSLLRVLQEREVLRVGGRKPIPVDVRVIAASNRRLDRAVDRGEMREDLYFRLNVVNLVLPPLRERRDDIPLLAYYFLKRHALAMGKRIDDIQPEALERLVDHDYPGNVRELSNIIERGVALARTSRLALADLPRSLRETTVRVVDETQAPLRTLEEQEAIQIRQALEQTGGNRTQAARLLGIDRVSLWRKIKRLGIDVGSH